MSNTRERDVNFYSYNALYSHSWWMLSRLDLLFGNMKKFQTILLIYVGFYCCFLLFQLLPFTSYLTKTHLTVSLLRLPSAVVSVILFVCCCCHTAIQPYSHTIPLQIAYLGALSCTLINCIVSPISLQRDREDSTPSPAR